MRNDRKMLVSAAGAGLLLAVIAGHHSTPAPAATGTPATVAAIPGGSSYTPATWARAFLAAAGVQNDARYNPLNTTLPEPGSWAINSVGVQAFPSWHEGLEASVAVLENGLYPAILAALRAGNDAQQAADAVAASPWGTGSFEASC